MYYEIPQENNLFSYRVSDGLTDYLKYSAYLFHTIKFLKRYEKFYNNDNIKFKENMYSNVRFHESEIRLAVLLNDFNTVSQNEIFPSYLKNIKKLSNDRMIFYKHETIDFMSKYFKALRENSDFVVERTENESYNNIFLDYSYNIKFKTRKILDQIYKQYTKSIFYDYDFDILVSFIKQVYNNNDYVLALSIDEKIVNENITKDDLKLFFVDITCYEIDLYTLFRMFIKKGTWDLTKNPLESSNSCSKLSYPKNIVCKYGEAHILFLKLFIESYFILTVDERNGIKNKNNVKNIITPKFKSHENNIIENDDRKILSTRCIHVPKDIIDSIFK